MRKVLNVLFIALFLFNGIGFCSLIREMSGTDFETKSSTPYSITVSSYSVTTLADLNDEGLERIYTVYGAGTIFVTWGTSTSTTTARKGIPLTDSCIVVDDTYFGDTQFIADTDNTNVRVNVKTKKIRY